MNQQPLKRIGVREEKIGDERYLYGANQETLTVLNAVAAMIWDLCDGDHTLDAISIVGHDLPISPFSDPRYPRYP